MTILLDFLCETCSEAPVSVRGMDGQGAKKGRFSVDLQTYDPLYLVLVAAEEEVLQVGRGQITMRKIQGREKALNFVEVTGCGRLDVHETFWVVYVERRGGRKIEVHEQAYGGIERIGPGSFGRQPSGLFRHERNLGNYDSIADLVVQIVVGFSFQPRVGRPEAKVYAVAPSMRIVTLAWTHLRSVAIKVPRRAASVRFVLAVNATSAAVESPRNTEDTIEMTWPSTISTMRVPKNHRRCTDEK